MEIKKQVTKTNKTKSRKEVQESHMQLRKIREIQSHLKTKSKVKMVTHKLIMELNWENLVGLIQWLRGKEVSLTMMRMS
jgi:hypothetical protein